MSHRAWSWAVALVLSLMVVGAAQAANLAREAAYEVTIAGFAYRGQVIPGTNTPAAVDGFAPAPPWQGPQDTLTDGRHDSPAVYSWFWSQMNKRITVRFDLRRAARVSGLRVWAKTGSAGYDRVTARITGTAEGLAAAPEVVLVAGEESAAWAGEAMAGRFVEIVCASSAPQMTLAEVEIEGEPAGDVAADAPPPGLRPVAARDLGALTRLPDQAAGVTNLAARPGVKLTLSSSHYDDKTGKWADDSCAVDSDPTGKALVDGDHAGGVKSFSGWYGAKRISVDVDLGQAAQVERVIVWSAGHGTSRAFVNSMKLWVQAGAGGAWTPAGEVWNPVLPGEVPAASYPIVSPVLDKPATAVRVELVGVAQSADLMQVSELEVWGKGMAQPLVAKAWRVKQPVPAIAPVATGILDPAYDWIQRERVRAMYGYIGQWQNDELLRHITDAGFNCMLVHTMGKTHSAEGWPAEVAQWVKVEQERKLRVIISWPFGSDERYGNTQFGAYQPGGAATWKRGPCPLSREYWERVVGDRAVIAAEAGLTGLVVDMEMYGADATRYPGPCYCESCWGRFVGEYLEGIVAAEVALADRPAWVAANGLTNDYARWQELQVMGILNAIRDRVRAVNPRFLLGNLLDPESLAGLARGFGTPTMPALVFSELEYHGGIAGVPGRLAQLRARGYPVCYVPGLWIQPVTPPQLPELVKAIGPPTGGYWIWSDAAFAPNVSGEYAHAAGYSHDDYWQAFRRAHEALTAALRDGAAAAPAAPTGPRAVVPRTAGAEPTAAEWAQAAVLGPFVTHRDGLPAKVPTTARALWDGQRLHLWVTCAEPTLEKMTPLRGERDDATLWQQDSLEIFWRRPDSGAYVHVIVNAAGTVADALSDGIRPEDPGWNAEIPVQATRGQGAWEVRLALPLTADGAGPLPAGSTVRFELARNQPGSGGTTCWAPTGGMFRGAPDLWGTLELR